MATLKKRINLTVDEDTLSALEEIKKITKSLSLSALVLELTKEAIEIREDIYFAKLADKREKEKTIKHSEVWG